jgi:hypothetical protein
MGMFLNTVAPYERYKAITSSLYFVDKTSLLDDLLSVMVGEPQYICITRPRRFGKTVMANMVGAFFSKAEDSSAIFNQLKIAKSEKYQEHLNQHDVIYIDFSEIPKDCKNYQQYISRIQDGLLKDLMEAYPELNIRMEAAVWDVLSNIFERTMQKFIFVIDEWDAVFHMPFISLADQQSYLLFLKALLKSKAYVRLAYMTGILPIAKYSGGSELNMFLEYSMTTKIRFSEYFGFSDTEVDMLFQRFLQKTQKPLITRDSLREWYNGYHTAAGERMYNPRSVVCALTNNQLANYWTSSGPYDEIFYYIKNNISDVQDELALMIAGESIPAEIQEYAAIAMELKTKDEIYSAMVVYGLLTYENGCVSIPNKELMNNFAALLKREESLGYVYRLAKESGKMLKATLAGDVDTMARILQYAHDTETPILSYHHEVELSAVVNLVYLSARDQYRIEREDKAGEGFVDFIFYPINPSADCMILELKVDHTPAEAIQQIKDKQYILRFHGKLGELPKYTGRILAVGISYDRTSKKHTCKVEVLE